MIATIFCLRSEYCIYQDESRKDKCNKNQKNITSFSQIYYDPNIQNEINVSVVGNISDGFSQNFYHTFFQNQIRFVGISNDSAINMEILSTNKAQFNNIIINIKNGNIMTDDISFSNCTIMCNKKKFLRSSYISIDFISLNGINYLQSNKIVLGSCNYQISSKIPYLDAKEFVLNLFQNNSYIYQLNTKLVTNISGIINQFYIKTESSEINIIPGNSHVKIGSFATSAKSVFYNLNIIGQNAVIDIVGDKWNNHFLAFKEVEDCYIHSAQYLLIKSPSAKVHFNNNTHLKYFYGSEICVDSKDISIYIDKLMCSNAFNVIGYSPTIIIKYLESYNFSKKVKLLNATYEYIPNADSIPDLYIENIQFSEKIKIYYQPTLVEFKNTASSSINVIVSDDVTKGALIKLFKTNDNINVTYTPEKTSFNVIPLINGSLYGFSTVLNAKNYLCFSNQDQYCPEGTRFESIEEALKAVDYNINELTIIEYPAEKKLFDLTQFKQPISLILKKCKYLIIDEKSTKMIDIIDAYSSLILPEAPLNCSLIRIYYGSLYNFQHLTKHLIVIPDPYGTTTVDIKADVFDLYSTELLKFNVESNLFYGYYNIGWFSIYFSGNPKIHFEVTYSYLECNITSPIPIDFSFKECQVNFTNLGAEYIDQKLFSFELINTTLKINTDNGEINGIIKKAINSSITTDAEVLIIKEDTDFSNGLYLSSAVVECLGVGIGATAKKRTNMFQYNQLVVPEGRTLEELFSAESIRMERGSAIVAATNILLNKRRIEIDMEMDMSACPQIIMEQMHGDPALLKFTGDTNWDSSAKEESSMGIPVVFAMRRAETSTLRDWAFDCPENLSVRVIDEVGKDIQIIEVYHVNMDFFEEETVNSRKEWLIVPIVYIITTVITVVIFVVVLARSKKTYEIKEKQSSLQEVLIAEDKNAGIRRRRNNNDFGVD